MTELPPWRYTGFILWTRDLSALEINLHAGRIAAAERGYQSGPDSIAVDEVMHLPGTDAFLSVDETFSAGIPFAASHLRFVMIWNARNDRLEVTIARPRSLP
jgi:hypothetical protein